MEKRIITILLLIVIALPCQAQWQHEGGSWSSVQISGKPAGQWSLGMRGEHRRRDGLEKLDLAFMRLMVGYSFSKHLSAEVAVDHMWRLAGDQNRLLLSATGKWQWGPFRLSLRQRYVRAHGCNDKGNSDVMRTLLSVSYPIASTCWTPYIKGEGYYWDHWQLTHLFAGTQIRVDKHSSFDLFYIGNIRHTSHYVTHGIGVGYNLQL